VISPLLAQPANTHPSTQLALKSLIRADFTVLVKNRRSVLLSTLLPFVILFSTTSAKTTTHLGGSLFVIGLCISYGLAATSIMGYPLNIARDREKGVFQRLRVTPAPAWTIMASRLGIQGVINLLIALVVLAVGARIHHVSLSVGQYGLVLLVSILGSAVFLSIGQALVGLVKSADTVSALIRVVFIGLVFLGLFGQSNVLGTGWEDVARWTPVGAVMTLFAGVLHLSLWNTRCSLSLLACCAYIVVFASIGIRFFQWEAR
jgi:ABC-2 type transport system permease protein